MRYGLPKETVSIELWVDPEETDSSISEDSELSTRWSVSLDAYDRLIKNDEDRMAGKVFDTHNYEFRSHYSLTDSEFKKVFKTVLKRYLEKGEYRELLSQYPDSKVVYRPTFYCRGLEIENLFG